MSDNLFIEFGANLGTDKPTVRNVIKTYSQEIVEEFMNEHGNTDVFTSVFKYDKEDIRQAKQAGPLYFDLDGEYAQADLRVLIEFLTEQGCPQESIRLFYSGFKGFHLLVLFEALGIEPDQYLNKIYEVIVKTIKTTIHASSIDTNIYDAVRLFRLPNSINPKSGLYKVPLTLEELALSLDEIKKLAENPRTDLVFPEPIQWGEFRAIFQKAKKKALKTKRGGIFEPVGEGQRNDATFSRALKLKAEGKSFEEAIEVCLGIEDEPQLSESEIKRTVASAFQDKYTAGKDDDEEKAKNQAMQVFEIASEAGAVFFHDQFNAGYLAPEGNGKLIFKVRSRACESWLAHLYWKSERSVLNSTTLNSIIQMLEARARFEGSQYPDSKVAA
jgi:hypothetical protein